MATDFPGGPFWQQPPWSPELTVSGWKSGGEARCPVEELWLLVGWAWTEPRDGHTVGCDKGVVGSWGHGSGRGREVGGRACAGEGSEGGETNSQVGAMGWRAPGSTVIGQLRDPGGDTQTGK